MAGFFVKNTDGVWVPTSHQYVKRAGSGWNRVLEVHQKTGASTWTKLISYDETPPSPPTITTVMSATAKTLTTTVKLPSQADVVGAVIKISPKGYVASPESSEYYHSTVQADGQPYSTITAGPGATKTRVAVNAGSGRKYYIRCWAKDSKGNYSAPANWTGSFPYPAAPAPTLVTKTAYVTVSATASYSRNGSYWRADNNYVYQGGENNWEGRWFYGGKIKTLLSKAVEVKFVKIYLKRHNSTHGVSGKANILMGYHGQTAKPSGAPASLQNTTNVVDLSRNEGVWYTIPSARYASLKSGQYAGMGLYAGTTSYTSANYAYLYGTGTDSGKLQIQWTEYA